MSKKMWEWVNGTLMEFRHCFSNKRSFGWFVVIMLGLMLRTDTIGLTGIVRELSLLGSAYAAILHFFRAESWHTVMVRTAWLRIVSKLPLLYRVAGRAVLVGDGVKQSKEGKHMPGVVKLHQESENSAKGSYIFGHMFGGIGVLLGHAGQKLYCLLLSLKLHEGVGAIHGWGKEEAEEEESHVVKMIKDAFEAVQILGPSLLLLDRLYLTIPMLKALAAKPGLQVVTKAKSNATAYYDPKPKTGPGAKAKKGESVKVASLFQTKASEFVTEAAYVYGKVQSVRYYSLDLLWGKKLYQKLRFVLVILDGRANILVSTDLTLTPIQIIELYCCRFKIECAFRELKQVVAGFSYRFWSKSMPKLSRYKSNAANQERLAALTDEDAQAHIESTVRAIEGYALLSAIALGLLQLISLLFSDLFTNGRTRFMRTVSNAIPSEATVADYMRKNIYQLFRFLPDLAITTIIRERQNDPDGPPFEQVS